MTRSRPRIAIATCAAYEELKVGDRLLGGALKSRGAEALSVVWDGAQPCWEDFDLCLVRSTWDYHDKYDEFLAWTREVERATMLHNPADVIAWNSDKTYLRELGERGVPTVPTVWVDRGSDADVEEILSREGWQEAVIKPVIDLGAKNLHRVRAGAGTADDALASVLSRSGAMVQPFLPSLEAEGEFSLIFIDGAFSHAVRKRPAAGDFRVQSIWGGKAEATTPDADHLALAERALTRLNEPPLYARVDLVTGPDGSPCLIELELIEPNLYLGEHPQAAAALAEAALLRIDVDADRDVLQ
jgi:glutathione synthase/RimK-type ligase-like ATP-grasp enzyme